MYFFYSQLPTSTELRSKYDELVLKYPDTDRYLYTTSLNKLLSSLDLNQQKECLMALENSEELAQKWIHSKPELEITLTEHLERSILAVRSQLL